MISGTLGPGECPLEFAVGVAREGVGEGDFSESIEENLRVFHPVAHQDRGMIVGLKAELVAEQMRDSVGTIHELRPRARARAVINSQRMGVCEGEVEERSSLRRLAYFS